MMISLQAKNSFKSSIWGWTKNSSNPYSKWVHSIFLIDSFPKAAWFYFNFSLIAKGANHVQHVPAAEKRLSEGKNSFNQSRASLPWGLRSCRAGMLKGKSHRKAQKDKAPQLLLLPRHQRDGEGQGGTQGWTWEGQAARPVPGKVRGSDPEGPLGIPGQLSPDTGLDLLQTGVCYHPSGNAWVSLAQKCCLCCCCYYKQILLLSIFRQSLRIKIF